MDHCHFVQNLLYYVKLLYMTLNKVARSKCFSRKSASNIQLSFKFWNILNHLIKWNQQFKCFSKKMPFWQISENLWLCWHNGNWPYITRKGYNNYFHFMKEIFSENDEAIFSGLFHAYEVKFRCFQVLFGWEQFAQHTNKFRCSL